MIRHLLICSKSTWDPAIRREHALAALAAEDGLDVTFLQRPRDVRMVSGLPTARSWLRGATAGFPPVVQPPGVEVRARTAVIPAHLGRLAQSIDTPLLDRELRRLSRGSSTVVLASTPWQWPAVRRVRPGRRLFDCADDWSAIVPARRKAFLRLYERVAGEADAISVASPGLSSLFPGRKVDVVRNGVSTEMLLKPIRPLPVAARAVYAGTLSRRFDVELVRGMLEHLPDWRLDLYGQCQYPGRSDRPDDALLSLLDAFDGRTAWHGTVARSLLARAIDSSRVCILPHRRSLTAPSANGHSGRHLMSSPSWRGDAMKLYDYAARGRPIVSTRWEDNLLQVGPPHLYLADTKAEFCDAVIAAVQEPAQYATERRTWAEQHTWASRWRLWRGVIRGTRPS